MRVKWLAALVALLIGSAAFADERILDFHSDVTVQKDGSMVVHETIKVRVEQNEIKHGIYREFPTLYHSMWFVQPVPFDVIEVKRDGKTEPYHTTGRANGKRVYIGDADVVLPAGQYVYEITYNTNYQIGFFKDHDELYWNVTGNGWDFPIDRASATVFLPAGVPKDAIKMEAYTGPAGAKGRDYTSALDVEDHPAFATKAPMATGEGLTIVVSWPPGFVTRPTSDEALRRFFAANMVVIVCAAGVLAASVYYLIAWVLVGRDPPKGTIIPLFKPPEGFSPIAARYVLRMGYDEKCFTSGIVDIAVKGYWRIEEAAGDYTLVPVNAQAAGLTTDEQIVAKALLPAGSDPLPLKQENHSTFQAAQSQLKRRLSLAFEKQYFITNAPFLIPGIALSILTVVLAGITGPLTDISGLLFISLWLSIWSLGVVMLLVTAARAWRGVLFGGGGSVGGAIAITLFSLPFIGGEIFGLFFLAHSASIWLIPTLVLLGAINYLFHYLLKAPTHMGRALMDQIEGFRMYLRTAEAPRMKFALPPEKTPQLFEMYLPYAIALNVENEWSEQFAEVLKSAEVATGQQGRSMSWYSGAAFSTIGATGFASSMSSSLSSAVSSASTSPGSSSGGGGGGSSGGGGGGGGGGGW